MTIIQAFIWLRLRAILLDPWNIYYLPFINLWIWNRVNAKSWYFFSGDVTRSSPVLYHEYSSQDGNLVPKFSFVLLTLPLPVFTTHALLPIFPEESWVLEWNRIRVEGQIWFENGYVWTSKFLNPERNSCGFKNIRIRVEGAWMNAWMACHPVSLC